LSENDRILTGARDVSSAESIDESAVHELLIEIKSKLNVNVIIIFDQFEVYLFTNQDKFLTKDMAWISATQTRRRNKFWNTIAADMQSGKVKLLFVVRSDAGSGLHGVRFTETNAARPVLRLNPFWLDRLVDQVLADDGKGSIIGHPENGWLDLRARLRLDLSKSGSILPQEVRITFLGLRELSALTPSQYNRAGGASGVEALYIKDSIKSAAVTGGLDEQTILMLLLAFVDHAGENKVKSRFRTDSELTRIIPNDVTRHKALERLAYDELIRKRSNDLENGAGWQLDHDYLAEAVLVAERVNKQLEVALRNAEEAWERTAGLNVLARYRALLPITTLISLFVTWVASKRSFPLRPYRDFLLISSLKLLPIIIIIFGLIGWQVYVSSATFQIQEMIRLAPSVRPALGNDGSPAWVGALALSGHEDEGLRLARASVDSEVKAKMLIRVADGLARRGRGTQAVEVLKEALSSATDAPENSRMEIYGDIVSASGLIGREWLTDSALTNLTNLASKHLQSIPQGNNRNYVLQKIADSFVDLGHPDLARDLLKKNYAEINNDRALVPSFVEILHCVGEDEKAISTLKQLNGLQGEPKEDHMNQGEDVVATATLSCVNRLLGQQEDAQALLQTAINMAMSLPAINMHQEDREYSEYFAFWNGSRFAERLIDVDRADVATAIALREGDPVKRVEILVAAPERAYQTGKSG